MILNRPGVPARLVHSATARVPDPVHQQGRRHSRRMHYQTHQDNETTFSTFCLWEFFLFTSSINQLFREILHVKFLLTSMRIPLLPPAIPFFAFVSDTSLRWLPHHAFTRGRTRGFVTHDNAAFHARPHVYTKIPFPTKVLFHTNHSFYMSVVWAACG